MIVLEVGTVVITVLANIILGLLVLVRDTKKPYSLPFFSFTMLISVWATTNLLTDYSNLRYRYESDQAAFISAFLAICAFTWFVLAFTGRLPKSAKLLLSAIATITTLATADGLVITGVKVVGSGTESISGALYNVYVLAIVALVGISITVLNLRKKRVEAKSQKAQISLIQLGVFVATLLALLFNVVLPVILNDWRYANFGPFATVILVATISYAIIKHGLFDIKLIVARSAAYALTLVSIGLAYGFISFSLIGRLLFKDQTADVAQQVLDTILAVIFAFTFQPLKKFFDRITNKLFYRYSYDTQVFLDNFNKTLVATYELDDLLRKSVLIVQENIKPTYCFVVINETKNTKNRLVGSGNKSEMTEQATYEIKDVIRQTIQNLIVVDELEAKKYESLQKLLLSKNIMLIAKLSASSSSLRPDVGYIVFGPKKSGDLYSSQDLKIIEIITNELVIAVQNALRFEEIANFNLTLQQKVDDATKKLRHANEKLKALDETKDDFISMASHQLRTPLTSVKGYISMMMEGDAGKITPVQHKMLQQAFFSSQQMVYLIADLLNVSRLRTGKFVIQPSPVHLSQMIEEELSQLKEAAKLHSLSLDFKPPKNFPELLLDETKIRQVIMNFIDNAIYYTPAGGNIEVQLINKAANVEFRVIDTGLGVPKSEQPHLFTKFYRAANARKARPDGTGLGLFMARKVIVAQGGSIIFESKEGKGSTFGFVFNKTKLPPITKTTDSV